MKSTILNETGIDDKDVLRNETVYLNEKNSKGIDTCSSSKEVQ
ncbi:hypothetical protein [Rossellomorea marisflavi]